MPWKVEKSGNKWEIVKADTGKVVGHSISKAKAQASVKARYAGAGKNESLSEIRNMADFVRKVVTMTELNEVELEESDIEGKTYARIPDSVTSNLSGSMAAAFGVKIRDGKGWVPKGRRDELIALDAEISQEVNSCVLFELK